MRQEALSPKTCPSLFIERKHVQPDFYVSPSSCSRLSAPSPVHSLLDSCRAALSISMFVDEDSNRSFRCTAEEKSVVNGIAFFLRFFILGSLSAIGDRKSVV